MRDRIGNLAKSKQEIPTIVGLRFMRSHTIIGGVAAVCPGRQRSFFSLTRYCIEKSAGVARGIISHADANHGLAIFCYDSPYRAETG